jgi:hypothetical protein
LDNLKSLTFLFILLCSQYSSGEVRYKDQVSFSLGMVNSAFSQSEETVADGSIASSGSVAVISFDLSHEIFSERKKSYFYRVTGSGVAGEVSKYYGASGGRRYYFGADGTSSTFTEKGIKISTTPMFRYYAGWTGGVFYMVYQTEKEVRSDVGVEFGGLAGLLYSRDNKSSYKMEMTALKGSGVETTSINFQVFFGFSYFVDSVF